MPANADETKALLLAAAEQLFATNGIDAVSLRQVNLQAGQKNTSAVRYHFGDMAGIIDAILETRMAVLNEARTEALDKLKEQNVDVSIRDFMNVLVLPLASKTCIETDDQADQDQGWRYYVQLLAQLTSAKGDLYATTWQGKHNLAIERLFSLVREKLPNHTDAVFRQRQTDAVRFVVLSISDRVSLEALGKKPVLTAEAFISNLCIVATAILEAE